MGIIRKWINMEGLPKVLQRVLFGLCGLLCILMSSTLRQYVHFIVGTAMLAVSAVMMVNGIRRQTFKIRGDRHIPTAVVGIALGVLIIAQEHGAIPFIAVAWGINGLGGGIEELSQAQYGMTNHERFKAKLIHGLVETILALLLIFDPYEKIGEHIVILGLEMLVQAASGNKEHPVEPSVSVK